MIDLVLLENLRDIQATQYDKEQSLLLKKIFWCVTEIQNKHRNFNNNEDQYNSMFQSLLSAKEYEVLDQTQRGASSSGKTYGEIDIEIFSKDKLPLSILEAFIIDSIDTNYIEKHLKKLSENYDPNGIRYNYAIIYAKSKNFSDL